MAGSARVNVRVKIVAFTAAAVVGVAYLDGCGSSASSPDDGGMSDSLSSPDGSDLTEAGSSEAGATDAGATDAMQAGEVGLSPFPLSTPTDRRIAAGNGETCAASSQSSVVCWGNHSGQNGSYTALSGAFSNLAIGTDGSSSEVVCGVGSTGSVSCALWVGGSSTLITELGACTPKGTALDLGLDRQAGTGDLALTRSSAQATVVSPNSCLQFAPPAGAPMLHRLGVVGGHACGLTPSGAAVCWNVTTSPVDAGVSEPTPADHYVDIAESSIAACAATTSGAVRCWSSSGVETPATSGFPHAVAAIKKQVIQLATDGADTDLCALFSDGSTLCSYNFEGDSSAAPLLTGVVEIAVGVEHVCGVRPDDTVVCAPNGCSPDCTASITPPAGFKVRPAH